MLKQPSYKLYVLVDKTLQPSQQAVQACHAVAEFALRYGKEWNHQSMVLLAVDGEEEMLKWDWDLSCDLMYSFQEPYWDNRLTAIAAYGCDGQGRWSPVAISIINNACEVLRLGRRTELTRYR